MKFTPPKAGQAVCVTDGAWSSQLQARGLRADMPAELANLTQPHLVVDLARDYLAAGSEILTTNTFAANRLMLGRRGVKADVRELNQAGAQLAADAAAGGAVVLGSLGPSGSILAVREKSEAELVELFAEQAAGLLAGGVAGFVLETFSELDELLLAIRAIRQVAALPVVASLSFDSGPQRTRTLMGVEAAAAASSLEQAGADVVGCNCGAGVVHALPAVVALRSNCTRPVWVKPSAGLPELEEGRPVYRTLPEEFATPVSTLIDAGADFVGGCCGVGPEHIRRVAAIVASRRARQRVERDRRTEL